MLTSINWTGSKKQKYFKYKPHVLSGSLEQYLYTLKKNSLGWQNRYSLDCFGGHHADSFLCKACLNFTVQGGWHKGGQCVKADEV